MLRDEKLGSRLNNFQTVEKAIFFLIFTIKVCNLINFSVTFIPNNKILWKSCEINFKKAYFLHFLLSFIAYSFYADYKDNVSSTLQIEKCLHFLIFMPLK